MSQSANILQELQELESNLPGSLSPAIYSVPDGYFEGLASFVLSRIKAMEAGSVKEELSYLSPFLADNLSNKMPFHLPQGYFESLEDGLLHGVKKEAGAKEELETLSPLLSGLKKEMPFTVPPGYFDNLSVDKTKPAAKVVSLGNRKWFRYAAAAVVTGIILATAFILKQNQVDPNVNPHAWVKKNTKKVSTEKIEEFIRLTDEDNTLKDFTATSDKKEDIKELLKDVPESEIQSLLNDTKILDDTEAADDEILMN